MKIEKIKLEEVNNFSNIFLDYINGKSSLKTTYGLPPKPENFLEQIKLKSSFSQESRTTLVKVLNDQYSQIDKPELVQRNIESLGDSKTFTITTGHQLNIFTGPLYFVYKIVTVVNICKKLKEQHPECNFVPVYWMASEDHDFDEIASFNLFGKKYTWETEQTGAVGRMNPQEISKVLEELPEKVELFEKAYQEHDSLAAATRYFVNELFGKYGLIALDADESELKKQFVPFAKDDLINHRNIDLVEKNSVALAQQGYKTQVYPRSVNLFYLNDGIRERIIKEKGKYEVLNTELSISEEEIVAQLEQHPEKFSPNVILRPLYQEVILPNLAYIGGPAEVAYWLQLKGIFDNYQVPFPILMPRNFALVSSKSNTKKLRKLPIDLTDLFLDFKNLKDKFVRENSDTPFSLEEENQALQKLYKNIADKAVAVDKSLEGFIGAEGQKSLKGLQNIEKRLKKAEEQKLEVSINQLERLKLSLFPNGGLQERHDNLLSIYINQPEFIDVLIEKFDPFDYRFNVLLADG